MERRVYNQLYNNSQTSSDSFQSGPRLYNFFMLNSAEHEIFSANKYENANWEWSFRC